MENKKNITKKKVKMYTFSISIGRKIVYIFFVDFYTTIHFIAMQYERFVVGILTLQCRKNIENILTICQRFEEVYRLNVRNVVCERKLHVSTCVCCVKIKCIFLSAKLKTEHFKKKKQQIKNEHHDVKMYKHFYFN